MTKWAAVVTAVHGLCVWLMPTFAAVCAGPGVRLCFHCVLGYCSYQSMCGCQSVYYKRTYTK